MELIKVAEEIHEASQRLENGSNLLFSLAQKMAETEKEYRRALKFAILHLREDKMQIAIITNVAMGLDGVAELRYQRDLAEWKFKVSKETLINLRAELSALQTVLSKFSEI